ncbi:hypothetical protein E3N88_39751 [Mikania micrantha]|uniref:Cytochrome b/b6 N-terminal region profile domain-containing protein n=1 Tax=Mikania micrantha TaxID=192012 RepID=A0A5N6LKR7_9ASTR|nr:hypothetical protein E3N88_39751 [Mikania micrantha]
MKEVRGERVLIDEGNSNFDREVGWYLIIYSKNVGRKITRATQDYSAQLLATSGQYQTALATSIQVDVGFSFTAIFFTRSQYVLQQFLLQRKERSLEQPHDHSPPLLETFGQRQTTLVSIILVYVGFSSTPFFSIRSQWLRRKANPWIGHVSRGSSNALYSGSRLEVIPKIEWDSHSKMRKFLGGGDHTYLNKVYDWFEECLEIQAIADDTTSKYVPPHVNIFYCLGGIMLTCFLVQVAIGFALTIYYRLTLTNASASASVEYIMTEANFGWLIR